MMKKIMVSSIMLALAGAIALGAWAQNTQPKPAANDRLAVVWTSADPDVANRVCLMYTQAAKRGGWFGQVELIIWGPSQKLFVNDKELQAKVKAMQQAGVVVEACIACAQSYGLVEKLRELGVTVKPMGPPLTGFLKDGWKVLTF